MFLDRSMSAHKKKIPRKFFLSGNSRTVRLVCPGMYKHLRKFLIVPLCEPFCKTWSVAFKSHILWGGFLIKSTSSKYSISHLCLAEWTHFHTSYVGAFLFSEMSAACLNGNEFPCFGFFWLCGGIVRAGHCAAWQQLLLWRRWRWVGAVAETYTRNWFTLAVNSHQS